MQHPRVEVSLIVDGKNNDEYVRLNNPSWLELRSILYSLKGETGRIIIQQYDPYGNLDNAIETFAEKDNYTLTFFDHSGIDCRVFDYRGPTAGKRIDLDGETTSDFRVLQDFDLVIGAFKEFLETGSVTDDRLKLADVFKGAGAASRKPRNGA